MRGADTVNEEFEVGFNQRFESGWYRAELAGRVVMVVFVACAAIGLLGRGPYSHRTVVSAHGTMRIDYEPIARHSTATTVTVHLHNRGDMPQPVELTLDQHVVEPMGFQHAIPQPNSASITESGVRLTFLEQPRQDDALIRLDLAPNAVGPVPVQLSSGDDTARWTMLVVP